MYDRWYLGVACPPCAMLVSDTFTYFLGCWTEKYISSGCLSAVYMRSWARLPQFYLGCMFGLTWHFHGAAIQRKVDNMGRDQRAKW